jgi:hypothetical protein
MSTKKSPDAASTMVVVNVKDAVETSGSVRSTKSTTTTLDGEHAIELFGG